MASRLSHLSSTSQFRSGRTQELLEPLLFTRIRICGPPCSFALQSLTSVRAYVAGMAGQSDVRPLQYTQFFFICRSMFLAFENQYYQMRHGVLDSEAYAGYQRSIATQLLAFRGFRLWWEMNRSVFSPEFVDHVDAMIADVPEADPASLLREWHDIAQAKTPGV